MASAKENGLPTLTAVIGTKQFEELRLQAEALRQEYKEARAESRTAHKLEALVLKQQNNGRSLREEELAAQLERAQATARDHLDKAARVRKMFQRERKTLQARADELAAQLEQQHTAHAAEVRALQEAHQQEARHRQLQLEAQCSQLSFNASQQEAQLREQHAAELAAMREEAAQALAEAAAGVAGWQQRCCAAESALGRATAELAAAQAEGEGLRKQARALAQHAEEVQAAAAARETDTQLTTDNLAGRIAQLEAALAQQVAQAAAEARQLRERHAGELEQLQARFAEVVARKDDAAALLRQQLAAATSQLVQLQEVLQEA